MNYKDKIRHLRNFLGDGCFNEIEKMYRGEPFDPNDEMYKRLLRYSEDLCKEYSVLCAEEKQSENGNNEHQKRHDQILDILFPGHGRIYGVGAGIKTVIGMVELGNHCYINANVSFMPDVLVSTGDYFICAPNVIFGNGEVTGNLSKIEIGNDNWLCADVSIEGDVVVENGCIVGLGSHVISGTKVKENTVFSGSPATFFKSIVKKQVENAYDSSSLNDKGSADYSYAISHFKKLGVDGDFTETIKMLQGKNYNSLDFVVSQINNLTHRMCEKRKKASFKERVDIDNKLFPFKGKNCNIGENIFVDGIGSVSMGDNVTIGDNVCLMGKIRIGNNCKIGDNVTLVAIGHGIYFEDRHISGAREMLNTGGFVDVLDGVSIGNNVKAGPKIVIDSDIKENTVKGSQREFSITSKTEKLNL